MIRLSKDFLNNQCFLPVKREIFKYLLFLNIISNLGYAIYFHDFFSVFSMIMLAASLAYIETGMYIMVKQRTIQRIFLVLLILIHNILIVIDYYLIWNFHKTIGQDIVDIVAETNSVEAENFIIAYLTMKSVCLWLLTLFLMNLCVCWLSKYLKNIIFYWICFVSVMLGFGILLVGVYNYSFYRNGMAIPQYQTLTRLGYSLYVLHQRVKDNEVLYHVCHQTEAKSTQNNQPSVVVVIGESFSLYHSSLYGYEKCTNPLLEKRKKNNELFVFDNALSIASATHKAMESIFSLDSLGCDFERYPLFPACFKSAGYKTFMYDNQYFVGDGVNFLADSKLSKLLFDRRNTRRFSYDLDMVNSIETSSSPSLYVIHLWGQHYTYRERYPSEYQYFNASDYDSKRWTKEQRDIIACYDNATRYNDFVINEIIKKIENRNICMVYFSDHGEEVYELGNFMGHGTAEHSKDLRYQIRVPFMIWISPSFKRLDIIKKLRESIHTPIMTDDVSHFLMDIAGIQTQYFRPTRSFINCQYNLTKPRIVLNSIDFDKQE